MPPIVILAMVNASLAFLKEAIPQIREMVDKGEISPEDQKKVFDEYTSLKNKADGQFSGPEWEPSNRKLLGGEIV